MDAQNKRGMRSLGKVFLIILTIVSSITASGCNFFGKLEEQDVPPTGQLSDGSTFVGSWTTSASPVSATGEPSYAITETYTFDPTGAARVEMRDMLSNGITCTGYGQYRQTGPRDLTIYLQAAEPVNCAFAAQIKFNEIEVKSQSIRFKVPQSEGIFDLFKVRAVAPVAPVGVWDFDSAGGDANGEGGIDYLYLDPKGYFLIQTTAEGESYLLAGYYAITGTELSLTFISNMDPSKPVGTPLVYKQFVTNGAVLELIEETDSGDIVYTGARL